MSPSPRQAARDLAVLLAMPRGERVGRVSKARRRFRGPLLAEGLLAESRRALDRDPREALDLAAAAKAVLYCSDLDHEDAPELWIRTFAYLGGALRRARRAHRRATRYLQAARLLLAHHRSADPGLWAELDRLETPVAPPPDAGPERRSPGPGPER